MGENSISNTKIKNSEVNQTINVFCGFDMLSADAIKMIKEKYPDLFKDDNIEEIKLKIEQLYNDAAKIVNTKDISLYMSTENMKKLKFIYKTLEVLEFYYSEKNSEEADKYYNNLFVILSQIDVSEAINKFFTFPIKIRENNEMIYLYATFLISIKDRLGEAEDLLYNLYIDKKYKCAFESLVRCYFLEEKYDKVLEFLSKANKEEFDESGFLASMFMISKNFIKQFNEKEILKYNNSKFKEMSLYYISTAHIIYTINPKSQKIKEQFKKGLKCVKTDDIVAISTICYEARLLNLKDEMIKFLFNIELTPYLKLELVEFLINKSVLNEKEILKLQELKIDIDEEKVDVDYIEGILLENQGKELKAIEKYEQSYNKKETKNSAYKYINLARKKFCEIKDEMLKKLSLNNDLNSIMMVSEGYKYKNDYENAIKNSYKALYLLKNNMANKEVLSQYWGCTMLGGGILHWDTPYICKDVGVILKSELTSRVKKIVIEDDIFYVEKDKILNVEIIRSTSDLGLELINKKVNDKVIYNNQIFSVETIKDKYTFFSHICFEKIKNINNIEIFESNEENPEKVIEQLKQKLFDIQESTNKRLDIYEESKNIPLSAFFSSERTAGDYAKIINTLLSDKERLFFAGEPIDINVEDGFVIDLSSIIVLALFDKLEVFTKEFGEKIYITTSLKNKVKYYYETLLKKHGQKETTLEIVKIEDGTQKLAKNEVDINKRISFWADIYKCINKFKVENVEATKDEVLNLARDKFLDKVQFDLIELAKNKKLPYICDDLLIRKLAGAIYKIEHTNCVILIEHFYKDDYNKYLDIIMKFVQCNYIYVMYGERLGKLFLYLYKNYDNKEKVDNILKELLKTKTSFDLHIQMLINMINNLKNIQYTKISDNVYINNRITDIIYMIIDNIKIACSNLKLNYGEYEKSITKESGEIEFKF